MNLGSMNVKSEGFMYEKCLISSKEMELSLGLVSCLGPGALGKVRLLFCVLVSHLCPLPI
jgi:hypothetical protein